MSAEPESRRIAFPFSNARGNRIARARASLHV